MTPQITLTATLQDILGQVDPNALIRITLAGYGSATPRVVGSAMVSRATQEVVLTNGSVSTRLWGNDVINPAGTFYCIQVVDSENTVVQSGNYQIIGGGSQDLSNLTPYTPPSPGEPVSKALIYQVEPGAIAVFDGNLGFGFELFLNQNTTGVFQNQSGNSLIPVSIIQPENEAFEFAWPSNVKDAGQISPVPGKRSSLLLAPGSNGNLYAVSTIQYA